MTRLSGEFQTDLHQSQALAAGTKAIHELGWTISSLDGERIVCYPDTASASRPPLIELELSATGNGTDIRIVGSDAATNGHHDVLIALLDRTRDALETSIESATQWAENADEIGSEQAPDAEHFSDSASSEPEVTRPIGKSNGAPYNGQPQNGGGQQVVYVKGTGNGMAVAALACGIVGSVFGLVPIMYLLALSLGLLGIIFGAIGRRKAKRDPSVGRKTMATWGLAMGLVAFALGCWGAVIVNDALDQVDSDLNQTQHHFNTQIRQASQQLDHSLNAPVAPQVPQQSLASRSEGLIRHYYGAVNRGSYAEAWALLSPSLQGQIGSYSSWRDGYRFTEDTDLTSINAGRATTSTASVDISLSAVDLDACGDEVTQTFAGSWTVGESGGGTLQATNFDVAKTGGGTPVRNVAACAPAAPSAPQQSASCDPNYSGCLNPASSDYDCAGGSGDGPDYTGPVTVIGTDVYGLDSDGDGSACETY